MRIHPATAFLSFAVVTNAFAQDATSLTRSEVAAVKAKIVAVQGAMGADPVGYLKESEDFNLPTDFNPAQGGKYWPITSGVTLRYTDRASKEGTANAEKAAQDFQTRYTAAIAAGNFEAVAKMSEELTRIQTAAMATAAGPRKENMQVYVQLNQNPTVGIDPDAVVLERAGVIVLKDEDNGSNGRGNVTVYVDPVALRATQELSKIELRTDQSGVGNRTGVYHVVIQLNGTVADAEAWAKTFNYDAILGVIDPR
jgi:hypothetical protein